MTPSWTSCARVRDGSASARSSSSGSQCARGATLSLSEIADHIVPAREAIAQCRASGAYLDRNAGYYLMSNLQGLCRPCHWVKTNEDKTHTGPWPDVIEAERAAPKRQFVF